MNIQHFQLNPKTSHSNYIYLKLPLLVSHITKSVNERAFFTRGSPSSMVAPVVVVAVVVVVAETRKLWKKKKKLGSSNG